MKRLISFLFHGCLVMNPSKNQPCQIIKTWYEIVKNNLKRIHIREDLFYEKRQSDAGLGMELEGS